MTADSEEPSRQSTGQCLRTRAHFANPVAIQALTRCESFASHRVTARRLGLLLCCGRDGVQDHEEEEKDAESADGHFRLVETQ